MRVGQTNRGGCSIVSRHPVKAVGAPLLAFLAAPSIKLPRPSSTILCLSIIKMIPKLSPC